MAGEGKIVVKGDELLKKHDEWAKGEASDASNGGKRREAIGAYAEKCGIENKALSQFRSGLKIKNEGKRKDWLRSLQLLMPVAEREIFGNEMDLDNPNEEQMADSAAAVADSSNQMAEEHGVGDGSDDVWPQSDEELEQAADQEAEAARGELEDEDPETAEFNAAVDDVMGDDGNVVTPFGQRDGEDAIDFESGAA